MSKNTGKSNELKKIERTLLQEIKRPIIEGLEDTFFNVGTSIFKWKNLPKSIPVRYPEKTLYENGMAVFFRPDGLDYMCLPVATGTIEMNVYGEPTKWKAFAVGSENAYINNLELDNTNSVLIWNDNKYKPTFPYVKAQVKQLANIEMTARMNINAQKMPFFFYGEDSQSLQNKNTFIELFECEPVFFEDTMNRSEFQVLQTGAPFVADKLNECYKVIFDRTLDFLGVSSIDNEKAERMVTAEVTSNTGKKILMKQSRLEQRKRACEQINKLFGLEVSIEVQDDVGQELLGTQKPSMESGAVGKES